jgi:hypothetical protein
MDRQDQAMAQEVGERRRSWLLRWLNACTPILNSRDSYAIPAATAVVAVAPDHNASRSVPEAVKLTAAPTINDTIPDIRK